MSDFLGPYFCSLIVFKLPLNKLKWLKNMKTKKYFICCAALLLLEMNASRNVVINKDFNMLKQSTLLINTTADLENYTIVWPLYF